MGEARGLLIFMGVVLCGYSMLLAMDNGEASITKAPTTKVLRSRENWKGPSPQLRKRNNAQLNNCGYIAVQISVHVYFEGAAKRIMNEFDLKGEMLDPENYYVSLFDFNVPITNDFIARMPKSVGLNREAKFLDPAEKKMLAEHVREITANLIKPHLTNLLMDLSLEEVVFENGNYIAYFKEPEIEEWLPQNYPFIESLKTIRAGLEKQYRWGRANQDGIWFSFEDPHALRPSMLFLTLNQLPQNDAIVQQVQHLSVLQRMAARLSPRLSRVSAGESTSQVSSISSSPAPISRASRVELLSRGSEGEMRPQLSSHRDSSGRLSMGTTPSNSPPRSPEISPRQFEGKRMSYKWPQTIDPIILYPKRNPLRIEVEIIEAKSGSC